MSLYCTVSEI